VVFALRDSKFFLNDRSNIVSGPDRPVAIKGVEEVDESMVRKSGYYQPTGVNNENRQI
jgi:hypothetical protein